MTDVRWTPHALESLTDRAIEREEAERALNDPTLKIPGHGGRTLFLRRYRDQVLGQEMVLCVVTERRGDEVTVITVYKTSQIAKYLDGGKR